MPELPEVETIRRGLKDELPGQVIKKAQALWQPSFALAKNVAGRQILSVDRRGKVLIINLDHDLSLLVHLKMTGQLVLVKPAGQRFVGGHPTPSMEHELPDKSTRVVIEFISGDQLFFNDQRKFGWIKLVATDQVNLDALLSNMGPEPLADSFTLAAFRAQLKRRSKSPIKPVILDQAVVAGVGNIYADESLHLAKIHPLRLAGSLSSAEAQRLHQAIRAIIADGIAHGGTSFTHYVNALGNKGDYLKTARVFRRQGQPCPVCGSQIIKIRVAGRGTHLCPKCQKPPRVKIMS